jgi:hypothetical protein
MAEIKQAKRGRGRPRGASRLNASDTAALSRMADLIVAEPMPPTSAMRRLGIHGDAITRRLLRKWKAAGSRFLEESRTRSQAPLARPATSTRSYSQRLGSSGNLTTPFYLSCAMQALHDPLNSPALKALQQMASDSTLMNMHNYFNSPSMRAMEDYLNGPSMAMRELDGPLAKAITEFNKWEKLLRGY